MSRTIKGSKGYGYEYWSRRPCSGWKPGRSTKRITHGIERARGKIEASKPEQDPAQYENY